MVTFVYESPLLAVALPLRTGPINEITTFTVQLDTIGALEPSDTLTCVWNATLVTASPAVVTHSKHGALGPYIVSVPALWLNDSYLSCPSPSFPGPFISSFNPDQDWALMTNATAWLTITKNGQEYSNEMPPIFFYPQPSVLALTPRVGTVLGGTQLTILGANFPVLSQFMGSDLYGDNQAMCRIGQMTYPAQVATYTSYTFTSFHSSAAELLINSICMFLQAPLSHNNTPFFILAG